MSVVVVPARDEEHRIAGCVAALGAQTVSRCEFEVVLVLDRCADRTAEAAERSARRFGLRLILVEGPGVGAGAARRLGMDLAAERLLSRGLAQGLIATTDADSRPAPDWLARQLAHVRDGARAIAGLIELDPEEMRMLAPEVLDRRERDAAERLGRVREADPSAAHHHFAGASIGVTAGAYRAVGGLEPMVALEDATFAERLAGYGIPILRPGDVRVRTSARATGRAARGLAVDLAVSTWAARRRYTADDFPPELLRRHKASTTVGVVIPTKECADTLGDVLARTVQPLRDAGVIDDVLVVDAASADGTAQIAREAGARVIEQDEVLADHGPALGKGDAMWRALHATSTDVVCFLDGDTGNPHPHHLQGLIGPLLADPTLQLVKGAFDRPLLAGGVALPNEGGRVTELMARPLLNLHEPRLAAFEQPLAGEFGGRRDLLESVPFPVGYGVEIAVLIDALHRHGLDALAECDLGRRQNRHQPLRALGEMAYAVLAAVERRVGERGAPIGGHYVRPWDDYAVANVAVAERPPLATLALGRGAGSVTTGARRAA
ncbi:MAG TPA: glucosyl-3-phosphoglycerate synthase [Solirubrobacteraceae bacterium]|nr:glucosyl-3-phosphoglycerate synthase [Solirubrobacteraceae bacterium]